MAAWKSLIASITLATTATITSTAMAQQSGVTNKELLARIEQLEAQLGQGGVAPASYLAEEDVVSSGYTGCDSGSTYGLYAVYENVWLKPHFTRDTAYNIVDPPGADGYVETSFDWDFSYSGRIELGFLPVCDGLGVRARYWRFDDDLTLNAIDPNGDIAAGFGEDSVQIGFDNSSDATFTRSLEMDVLDLEIAARQCNWIYSGGVRYAKMQQTYNGVDNNSNDEFLSGHDFEGLGLTTAIEFNYCVGGGLSVFAKTRGSLLYGNTLFVAFDPNDNDLFLNQNDNDLLAVAELQLGVDWRTCLASGNIIFATVAAETQYWVNAGTGAATSNAPYDELNYQNGHAQDADLGFIGLNIGVGVLY